MPQTKLPAIPGKRARTILIGEDDLDDQELFREIFSSTGNDLELQFLANGSQVINYLEGCEEAKLPGLIILDYNMPEMSGADILKQLKTIPRYNDIPKIIWSTSGSNIYKKKCLEFGASAYIIKPSNVNELKNVVIHMLSFAK